MSQLTGHGKAPHYSWTFEGDVTEAAKWLPFALGHAQVYSSRGVMKGSLTPTEGISILFDGITGRIHISASSSGMYMESALIDYTPIGCGSPLTAYRPWNLSVLDAAGPQGLFKGFNQTPNFSGLLQGLQSISFGCKTSVQVESMTVPACSDTAPPTLISGGGFCENGQLLKKQSFLASRPSLFSGLTRRYVQAVYGSDNYAIKTNPSLGWTPHVLVPVSESAAYLAAKAAAAESGGAEPNPFATIISLYPDSTLIYRTDKYVYFFILVNKDTATIHHLVFSPAGETILNKLRSGAFTQDEKQLESYALSSARPDVYNTLVQVRISGDELWGEALAFGWNSNSDGSKATVVTHAALNDEKMYEAQEFELQIHIEEDYQARQFMIGDVAYKATISRTRTGPTAKWNPRVDKVWGHRYLYKAHIWFSGSWPINGTTPSDPDCPVYSYYDYKDVKHVVRMYNGTYQAGSSGNSPVDYACGADTSFNPIDTYTQSPGVRGNKGVENTTFLVSSPRDSHTLTITVGSATEELWILYRSIFGCATGDSWSTYTVPVPFKCEPFPSLTPLVLGSGVPGDPCTVIAATPNFVSYGGVVWSAPITRLEDIRVADAYSTVSTVIIPFNDCCAAMYSVYNLRTCSNHTVNGGEGSSKPYLGYRPGYVDGSDQKVATGQAVQTLSCKTFHDSSNSYGMGTYLNQYSTVRADIADVNTVTMVKVQDQYAPVETATELPLWLDSFMNPSVFDLFHLIDAKMFCTSDLSGNYKADLTVSNVVTVKHGFTDTNIGAIGWQ